MKIACLHVAVGRSRLVFYSAAILSTILLLTAVGCEKEPPPTPSATAQVRLPTTPATTPTPVATPKPPAVSTPAPTVAPKPAPVLQIGMGVNERFHEIHTKKLNLACDFCHSATSQTYKDPLAQATNPADPRSCLGCHKEGGAQPFYGDNWQKAKVSK
ncbi:MAG: hypothetical protein HY673_11670 [Chloroflexi bacterium]|nr:hypothetical protein [Chloroflexota bacterium]